MSNQQTSERLKNSAARKHASAMWARFEAIAPEFIGTFNEAQRELALDFMSMSYLDGVIAGSNEIRACLRNAELIIHGSANERPA